MRQRSHGPESSDGREPGSLRRQGGSELLDAMEAMKHSLLASRGKEQVKRIVDLLG
jgi:hypothetical protein